MKVITRYRCEICLMEYAYEATARACEAHRPPLPAHVYVGAEVKLENRNRGYTLAVVKELVLLRYNPCCDAGDGSYPDVCAREGRPFPAGYQFHNWYMRLDRRVYLNHKWEEELDLLNAHYALTPEAAAGVERMDNCSS